MGEVLFNLDRSFKDILKGGNLLPRNEEFILQAGQDVYVERLGKNVDWQIRLDFREITI